MRANKSLRIGLISVLLIVAMAVAVSAAYYGDADLNGKVQASDARRILRHAAQLELITSEQARALADVDGNGRITAADARTTLRMASRLVPLAEKKTDSSPAQPGQANTDSEVTDVYGGITVTKLPYTQEGLTINSISFEDSNTYGVVASVSVTNGTGSAIQDISNFQMTCYAADGTVLMSDTLFLFDMNNGEWCKKNFNVKDGTVRILFGKAKIYEDTEFPVTQTETIDGFAISKLPYRVDGLTINSVSYAGDSIMGPKMTVTATNNTGKTIGHLSNIRYKCYDADGAVIDSEQLFLEYLNDGERCVKDFFTMNGTVRVLFGEAKIYEIADDFRAATSKIDGIEFTALPYTKAGLTITGVSVDGRKVTVDVRNDTGSAIKSYSSIAYKAYDKDGSVIDSDTYYLEDLNAGESCSKTIYLDTQRETVKVLFGDFEVHPADE